MRYKPLALAFFFALLFLAFSLLPKVNGHATLQPTFWIVGGGFLVWGGFLAVTFRKRTLTVDVVLRRPHYMQAIIQFLIYAYWGYYWREVYAELPLIFAQLAFAYAFDALLSLSRRGKWVLGFGAFPIVFSTNFFIWFRDEFFYFQFVMLAVIFLAKEFIRWERDGKQTHIFNPAAFGLALTSFFLIATGTTQLTWAQEIVTTLDYPPNIYLYLFVLGLNGMYFFSVTPVAAMTAMGLVALGAIYTQTTGVYYFIDSEIPVAVFLGLHLLITDPATSPKTFWGRVLFGGSYAALIFALYGLLWWLGAPTFYDKILCVPLLNLGVRAIDRFVESRRGFRWRLFDFKFSPYQRNLASMAVWIAFFIAMRAIGVFGETHEGTRIPFWNQACADGLRGSCRILSSIESTYCEAGSGWACNELGVHFMEGKVVPKNPRRAVESLRRACEAGFQPGCVNLQLAGASSSASLTHNTPRAEDFKIILQEGKGPLPAMSWAEIQQTACGQGWAGSCANLAMMHLRGQGASMDSAKAVFNFEKACEFGEPTSCANLGLMYRRGEGVQADGPRAIALLSRACDLGMPSACRWLSEERPRIN